VPRREAYVPKHRGPIEAAPARKKLGLRSTLLFSGAAVAATGIAVSSGVLAQQDAEGDNAGAALRAAPQIADDRDQDADLSERLKERERSTSRSDRRTSVDKKKAASLDQSSGGQATRKEDLSDDNPRDIARAMLPKYGFSSDQFGCLDALYVSESDWDPTADNPTSSAYGIPQALTETHDDLPADYMTNPASQIEWGLEYIRASYGTPCAAWEFKQANNWY
jgi:hypothetical protein